jgi:hypothetical protein
MLLSKKVSSAAGLLVLAGCASSRVSTASIPPSISKTYAGLSAVVPIGTPQQTAIAALETRGWQCWGYVEANRTIRETGSGKILTGPVLICEVLNGSEMNPFAEKYTARLLFEQNKLAGVEVAQRRNAF